MVETGKLVLHAGVEGGRDGFGGRSSTSSLVAGPISSSKAALMAAESSIGLPASDGVMVPLPTGLSLRRGRKVFLDMGVAVVACCSPSARGAAAPLKD